MDLSLLLLLIAAFGPQFALVSTHPTAPTPPSTQPIPTPTPTLPITVPPPHTESTPKPPPSPSRSSVKDHLLQDIISAIYTAGNFHTWAGVLYKADSSSLNPINTTFLIPSDGAFSHFPTDPFLLSYHIIPERLRFSDLQLFPTLTCLTTYLPSYTIIITNNSKSNFTMDESVITHPDLFVNSIVAVHGIRGVLNYSAYTCASLSLPPQVTTPEKLVRRWATIPASSGSEEPYTRAPIEMATLSPAVVSSSGPNNYGSYWDPSGRRRSRRFNFFGG